MNFKWLTALLVIFQLNCSVLGVLQDRIPTPEFDFESLSIKEITLSDITLKVVTSVSNPYPMALANSLLDMDLKIEGLKLSHISTDLGEIEAKKTKSLPMDIKFKYTDLLNLYQKFPNKPILELTAEGNMKVPIPKQWQLVGKDSLSFPFTKKREIPAILPNVEIKNFNILMPTKEEIFSATNSSTLTSSAIGYLDGLLSGTKKSPTSAAQAGLSGINLPLRTEFDFLFSNQAASDLNLADLGYNLKLAGENFLQGSPKEIVNSGKTSNVKVSTTFPISSISSSLYKTIQSHSANFELKGNSSLDLTALKEKVPFNYEKKGNFKW
jgi:hypothetical protein